jgi:hypothetical protein
MLHAFTRDVPLRCEIVYLNVTCIYSMCLWGCEIVYVNVTCIYWMCLWDVRLFMWMLHAFTRWAFEDVRLFMWMLHELFDAPVSVCEIVYVNVTWVY